MVYHLGGPASNPPIAPAQPSAFCHNGDYEDFPNDQFPFDPLDPTFHLDNGVYNNVSSAPPPPPQSAYTPHDVLPQQNRTKSVHRHHVNANPMDSFPYTDYETELQMHFTSVANASGGLYDNPAPNHLSYNQLASDIFLSGAENLVLLDHSVTLLLTMAQCSHFTTRRRRSVRCRPGVRCQNLLVKLDYLDIFLVPRIVQLLMRLPTPHTKMGSRR